MTAPAREPHAARPRRRPLRRALGAVALVVVTVAAATSCATAGEPLSAGTTAPAMAPSPLWPGRPPAPTPSGAQHDDVTATRVPGVPEVPSGDIRKVDAYAVVKAEVAAHRHDVTGADGLDEATADKIMSCSEEAGDCPVRAPVHRDLTGDGRDDLIVGIEMGDHLLGLRCYTLVKGVLTRIMATIVQPSSIEIAGRDLIVWEPSATPHYAVRSVYSWDSHRQYMDLKSDEIRRTDITSGPPAPEPS